MNSAAVMCPYHNLPARYRPTSEHVYRGTDFGPIWECVLPECDAYCGCHPNGLPLGQLANKELRTARMRAHAVFDALWKGLEPLRLAYPDAHPADKRLGGVMRSRAYSWLAFHMGIKPRDCHISHFDVTQCEAAITVLREHKPTSATIRVWSKQRKAEALTK